MLLTSTRASQLRAVHVHVFIGSVREFDRFRCIKDTLNHMAVGKPRAGANTAADAKARRSISREPSADIAEAPSLLARLTQPSIAVALLVLGIAAVVIAVTLQPRGVYRDGAKCASGMRRLESKDRDAPMSSLESTAFRFLHPDTSTYGSARVFLRVLLQEATAAQARAYVANLTSLLKGFDAEHCVTFLTPAQRATPLAFGDVVNPSADSGPNGKCVCRIVVDENVAETSTAVKESSYKAFFESGVVGIAASMAGAPPVHTASRIMYIAALPPGAPHDALHDRTRHMLGVTVTAAELA
jgi:hypothetical protein